jgi:hypothetical protein
MKRVICLAVLACAACGGSNGNGGGPDAGPANSVTGTVAGHTLNAQDAVFTFTSNYGGSIPDGVAIVAIADRPNLCALLQSSTEPTGNLNVLGVALLNVSFTGIQPLVTGPYTVVAGIPSNVGQYYSGFFASGTCASNTQYAPAAGSAAFNVTQVGTASGTHLKGTFSNISFGTDGSFSGTVDASYCAALNAPANGCFGSGGP